MLVIDEFDRITDPSMRRQLAETIKNFSDIQARVVFMIVGVASSLDALLGEHPSIQRNVLGIHVPLMSSEEVEHLIAAGAKAANITFEPGATATIVDIAKGLPYFVQLFCLYSARNALKRHSQVVELRDVRLAAESILEEAEPSLVAAYERAIDERSGRSSVESLSALANAESDAYGAFGWDAVKSALPNLTDMKLRALLDRFMSDAGGPILKPAIQSGHEAVAFVNANMRQYVLLRAFTRSGTTHSIARQNNRTSNQDMLDKPIRAMRRRRATQGDSA
jgi:hypothetical protein